MSSFFFLINLALAKSSAGVVDPLPPPSPSASKRCSSSSISLLRSSFIFRTSSTSFIIMSCVRCRLRITLLCIAQSVALPEVTSFALLDAFSRSALYVSFALFSLSFSFAISSFNLSLFFRSLSTDDVDALLFLISSSFFTISDFSAATSSLSFLFSLSSPGSTTAAAFASVRTASVTCLFTFFSSVLGNPTAPADVLVRPIAEPPVSCGLSDANEDPSFAEVVARDTAVVLCAESLRAPMTAVDLRDLRRELTAFSSSTSRSLRSSRSLSPPTEVEPRLTPEMELPETEPGPPEEEPLKVQMMLAVRERPLPRSNCLTTSAEGTPTKSARSKWALPTVFSSPESATLRSENLASLVSKEPEASSR
mmetsp:Transcript_19874/g.49338  ORF Transcript_19874/g.49338 Transcript_19874/m.49338 type:complete len:366 (+) Transcript_19874:2137-3234(+)